MKKKKKLKLNKETLRHVKASQLGGVAGASDAGSNCASCDPSSCATQCCGTNTCGCGPNWMTVGCNPSASGCCTNTCATQCATCNGTCGELSCGECGGAC
jgi:hypothetical protein